VGLITENVVLICKLAGLHPRSKSIISGLVPQTASCSSTTKAPSASSQTSPLLACRSSSPYSAMGLDH
jgi:hypothetical protein